MTARVRRISAVTQLGNDAFYPPLASGRNLIACSSKLWPRSEDRRPLRISSACVRRALNGEIKEVAFKEAGGPWYPMVKSPVR